jgi:HK97 gp10 family phage protein
LDAIVKNMGMKTEQVLASLAYQVEVEAKMRTPVDTGALKSSLNSSKINEHTYHVSDGVEYGIYQELGTSRMAAQPFLVPAVEKVRGQLDDKFKRLF